MSNKVKVLVRNGRHERPMLAILDRYSIGSPDTYNRGKWISKSDLPLILQGFRTDPSVIVTGRGGGDVRVMGTNIHNWVDFAAFEELFD